MLTVTLWLPYGKREVITLPDCAEECDVKAKAREYGAVAYTVEAEDEP